jgi:ATP adenylyltransferase
MADMEEPRYFFNFGKYGYVRGQRPEGCILCSIGAHDGVAVDLSVAESRFFVISINLYPFNPGHSLIFPKRHVLALDGLSDEEALELHRCTVILLDVLKTTHQAPGFNIGWNMGAVAGASIEHLHMQVIPRYPREIGMAELIGGQRTLVEDPRESARRVRAGIAADGRLAPCGPPA